MTLVVVRIALWGNFYRIFGVFWALWANNAYSMLCVYECVVCSLCCGFYTLWWCGVVVFVCTLYRGFKKLGCWIWIIERTIWTGSHFPDCVIEWCGDKSTKSAVQPVHEWSFAKRSFQIRDFYLQEFNSNNIFKMFKIFKVSNVYQLNLATFMRKYNGNVGSAVVLPVEAK